MAVKFKAKSFRFSNRLTYVIGASSAETGIPEADIVDACAKAHILKQAQAAGVNGEEQAREAAKKTQHLLDTLEETGKFEPRPKRLAPEVVYAIGNAAMHGNLTEVEILEQAVESEIVGVVEQIVREKAQMTHRKTWMQLLRECITRGASPSATKRNAWSSERFVGAFTKSIDALKSVKPRLSQVASGRVPVPGLGRVAKPGGKS